MLALDEWAITWVAGGVRHDLWPSRNCGGGYVWKNTTKCVGDCCSAVLGGARGSGGAAAGALDCRCASARTTPAWCTAPKKEEVTAWNMIHASTLVGRRKIQGPYKSSRGSCSGSKKRGSWCGAAESIKRGTTIQATSCRRRGACFGGGRLTAVDSAFRTLPRAVAGGGEGARTVWRNARTAC